MSGERRSNRAPKAGRSAYVIFVLLGCACPSPTIAASAEVVRSIDLSIEIDKSSVVTPPSPVKAAFLTNPEIAELDASNSRKLLVYGRKVGATNLIATLENGETIAFDIRVGRQLSELLDALKSIFPNAQIALTNTPHGLRVSGSVATPREAQSVRDLIKQFMRPAETLTFDVEVTSSTQVNLQVRIAEISKSVSNQLGINWSALASTGPFYSFGIASGRAPVPAAQDMLKGSTQPLQFSRLAGVGSVAASYRDSKGGENIQALLDSLESKGLATILAQPNLTTISGNKANFLAGGEVPVPMREGTGETVKIEYKPFGVSLEFTPTVMSANQIGIHVKSEVSELSEAGAVTLNGFSVPGLTVRRVDTAVELASGQSFAIAGLFKKNYGRQLGGVPGLGSIPVLGALFRSKSFQRGDTELVITITPYIVKPIGGADEIALPPEPKINSEVEQMLSGEIYAPEPTAIPLPNASYEEDVSPRMSGND